MASSSSVLKRLEVLEDTSARSMYRWLSENEVYPLTSHSADTTVYEAEHIWRVREKSHSRRGIILQGAGPLLERLKSLTRQKKLEQYAFGSAEGTGNIFFEKSNGAFVGAIVVPYTDERRLRSITEHRSTELRNHY